ncbi:hypothetical protein PSN45_002409 [Yamadazyma tenuis]|uniref:uncharacterized protein n=1 Tax=Candida tenuis TaxID=2315449 RepID=UPI00279B525F|nr:hypothetical protein PSN45_002409 [Yamadazyma tenuis]
MDLIDRIDVRPSANGFDATQVIGLPMHGTSESEGEDEPFSQPESHSALPQMSSILDRINAVKERLADQDGDPGSLMDEDRVEMSQPTRSVLLPQLEIDLSEIRNLDSNDTTQKIVSGNLTQETQPISIDERTRILAEQKKQHRMAQKQQLEQDISNVTLTDEENEELEATNISTSKDIKEAQRFLDHQKKVNFFNKLETVGPKKKMFSAMSFVEAFEEPKKAPVSPSHEDTEKVLTDDEINISSPVTSPLVSPLKTQNPIELYKRNLKGEIIDLDEISVPKVSRDKEISIKSKYLKKMRTTTFKKKEKSSNTKKLFNNLFQLNINQINSDPNRKVQLEEDEDEEIMENLLEKEIERARNIRRMEKMKEKAAQALLKNGTGAEEEDNDDNWDESDNMLALSGEDEEESVHNDIVDDEADDSDKEDIEENSDGEDEFAIGISHRKHKILDSEDDVEQEQNQEPEENNELTDKHRDEFEDSITYGDIPFSNSQLFKNLKPLNSDDEEDIQAVSFLHPSQNKSFNLESTQETITQVDKGTQADNTTQADKTTQVDVHDASTQVLGSQLLSRLDETQIIRNELDDITPEMVNRGRKAIENNKLDNILEQQEDEDNEEEMQAQIKMYEEKIRRKELKAIQRRKDMERKGYKNIIEGEAEESEDEWAGIGGADGEAEERANSEDEKMIDNAFNIDLNDEEVRKKFMEQYQIKDRKELEKLMDDVKNHRLVKKVGNGLNLELSDEEDEILMNYRKQKLKEQKLKMQEFNKTMKNLKSDKSKAFFESIQEDLSRSMVRIDDEDDDDLQPSKLEESFVKNKLSFLSESFNQYEIEQRRSDFQHDVNSDEDEDMNSLKTKSFNNLRKRSIREVEIETDNDQDNEEEDNIDFSDEDLLPKRKPSMMKSFRSTTSSTVSSFSGVTISKQYKTVSGSKASITFMSKKKKSPKLNKLQSFRKLKH